MSDLKHPVQPIYEDKHGVYRFKANTIIEYLFGSGKLNLNEISLMDFPNEDQRQLAQLLGYSVGGYNDLSYTEDLEIDAKIDKMVEILSKKDS